MGWTDSHLHHFVDAPIVYSVPSGDNYPGEERLDERRFRLADFARHEKASFIYEYDFGDSWVHEVVVEKTLPADPNKKYVLPAWKERLSAGRLWRNLGLLRTLEGCQESQAQRNQEMLDWLGGQFDPGHFDLQKINAELRGLGNLARPSPFLTH